ncbi:MFS transporter [Salmonella enterica]|nr:MFS transporter [Salmonella enterica]
MFSAKKLMTLFIIILVYLPVSLDATILHVAVPTLSQSLTLTNNQMLWVIDIYSLIMAGLLLPMGSLGDRIGYKKLMIIGSLIFGIASAFAALSSGANYLIFSRLLLAIGASMILPGTLSCIRDVFEDKQERNTAIGVWAFVGGVGASAGPLAGGYILEHCSWPAIFLINIPIVILALLLIIYNMENHGVNNKQSISYYQAGVVIVSILFIVYGLKSVVHGFRLLDVSILVIGLLMLMSFVRYSLKHERPMIDFTLLKSKMTTVSVIVIILSMISVVGFELLIAQELQFIHHYTPLEAGAFMFPFILSFSLSSFLVVICLNKFGLKITTTTGLLFGFISLTWLSQIDITESYTKSAILMILLGVGLEMAFLSSTSTILSAAPKNKAAAVGAIEGMAYELGAGLGVTIFGLLLSLFYTRELRNRLPDINNDNLIEYGKSIGESIQVLDSFSPENRDLIFGIFSGSFLDAHGAVLMTASIILFVLAIVVLKVLPQKNC